MKRKLIVICLFISFLTTFSQNNKREIDSLQTLLNNTKVDTIKVKYFLKLEYAYRFSDYKKGLDFADKALHISEKINWKKGFALCYNNIGNSYLDRGEHSEALKNYIKSLQYSEPFLKIRLMTLMNVSNIYLREKNFKLSLKYINDAYKIALKLNNEEEIAYCYYQLGLINRDQKNLKSAKSYFEKSLAIFKTKNNEFQIAELTNFIGEITTNYKQKLDYFLASKMVWDKVAPDYLSAVNNSLLIAKTYIEITKNDSLKASSEVLKSNNQLISEAEQLVNNAILYSKRSDTKENLMDAYGVLSEIKYLKNEFSDAYKYSALHTKIKDSIFSQESKNKIAALESQKEIALKDRQILLNKIILKDKEKQKWFLIFGLGFLTIIGSLFFYQSRNRKKINQKLEILNSELDEANKTKTRFFSILNHDLRSPVSNLIHFLHLQKENPELLTEESKKRLENKIISGAENLLISMEDLLLWSKGQMENFKPQPKLISVNSLFIDTQKHFGSEEKVKILFKNDNDLELITDENYLKTIIRNLTGNAIKALEKVENPTIIWNAWKENNETFLSITDNGSGASQEQFKALYDEKEVIGIKTGLGLHLIRDLAKAINCTISVKSDSNGTTFTMKIA